MIHDIIKRTRQEEGLTQLALAALADVPRSQIQILEKGGNVTRETLEKVLGALDLSLAVIPRSDIEKMRDALRDLDAVLAMLTSQIRPVPSREERLLEITRDFQDILQAARKDPAVRARIAAYAEEEARRKPEPDEE